MVCDECSRKLSTLATIDDKEKRVYGKARVESVKKYFTGGKFVLNNCLLCHTRAEGKNKYCLTCSHKNGICEMCGKHLTNTKMYKYDDIDEKDLKRKKKALERSRLISEEIKKQKGIQTSNQPQKSTIQKKNTKKIPILTPQIKPKKEFIPLFTEEDKKEIEQNSNNQGKINESEFDEIVYL